MGPGARRTHVQADGTGLEGLVAAFAGVAWAFAEGFTQPAAGAQQWLGDALGLVAALLWGLTTLVLRGSRTATASPEKVLLYQLAVSGVALCAAGWLLLNDPLTPRLLLALAAVCVGIWLVNRPLPRG